ncbi:precorrin-6y C5,15-methyltransferase (decarboxylating) subunit CbiE [Mameliella alba]|nr:precorrin-6y C5,15-methyltransferase (decarboxylating) subunit CbiE [Mameliella alba]MBY6171811.1 precorrin-6y C5,15-methyltransferase (decarboxylating) subunit CbiE [Mameliella alba]MBY6177036.1 precorrin-6y C5,15-methyltransferase (decarboxylating) subunit CbiE [Mameliella alba]
MSERAPWLVVIGLGEDGPDGLTGASRAALEQAEIVMGPPRHLGLLPELRAEKVAWPVPFAEGLDLLDRYRGRPVAVLASGDPFWFGAGSVIARRFADHEWRVLPGVSCFSLAAARLGWALEKTLCMGLHAAPLSRLRPHLARGVRLIVTLRDGAAVSELARYLDGLGFGTSQLWVMEALGGPREKVTRLAAQDATDGFEHPVVAAIEVAGEGAALPKVSGLDDDFFDSDGVMTKRPVRALTLSALAPKPFERLWDIGGGSGSIGIEWLLRDPTVEAVTVEPRADRIGLIRANAQALGVDRLQVVEGRAPDVLTGLPRPDVVFVGGGLGIGLLDWLYRNLPEGTRLVANAVTLESEALLIAAQADRGGTLLRVELAEAGALGPRRGWKSAYPVVQWSVTL